MESFNLLVRCLLLRDKVKKLLIYKQQAGIIDQWGWACSLIVLTTHLKPLNSSYNTFQINQYVFSINHSIASINKIIFVLKRFLGRATAMELNWVVFKTLWLMWLCIHFSLSSRCSHALFSCGISVVSLVSLKSIIIIQYFTRFRWTLFWF